MRKIMFGLALAALAGCQTICDKSAMEARYYPVEMPTLELMAAAREKPFDTEQENERGWKRFFEQFDVVWPEGSSIRYVKGINKLRVSNTSVNHERLEAAFAEWRRETDKMVEVEVRFVEVGQKASNELGDFASVAPAELERALVARRDLDFNKSWKLVTRNGEEAVGKRVTECIYPTDFKVVGLPNPTHRESSTSTNSESCAFQAVEPKNFMMREVGIILRANPMVSADDKAIDLRIEAQVVDEPTWRDYGLKIPDSNGAHYELPMQQPNFFVRSVDTRIEIVPGETALVQGAVSKDKDGEDKTLFVFVWANLLGAGVKVAKEVEK